jgi:hypothetical protein
MDCRGSSEMGHNPPLKRTAAAVYFITYDRTSCVRRHGRNGLTIFDEMQLTPFQRLFTDDRPLFFQMAVGATVSVVWTGSILLPTLSVSLWNLAWCIGLFLVAACLGAVIGAFPGGMFLGIVLQWVERRNGAPFREGDEVVILSKRYPGRVTRVYDVWAERHQVRVELDDRSRQEVTDVFSFTDVCRRRSAVE